MNDILWYRRLRGGMWLRYFGDWKPVAPEKYPTALELMAKDYAIEDHRYQPLFKKAKMKPENSAFLKRVTIGVLLGAFICTALHIYRPTTQADVEIAKIEAQSKTEALAAQRELAAKAEAINADGALQDRRTRCLIDVTNTVSRKFAESRPEMFERLVNTTCK